MTVAANQINIILADRPDLLDLDRQTSSVDTPSAGAPNACRSYHH